MKKNSSYKQVEGERLIALCDSCKCCIPRSGHCAICHLNKSIANLCGCKECDSKANAYVEIETIRSNERRLRFLSRLNANSNL